MSSDAFIYVDGERHGLDYDGVWTFVDGAPECPCGAELDAADYHDGEIKCGGCKRRYEVREA